jgi:PUA domain protein
MNIRQRHFVRKDELEDIKEDVGKTYNQDFLNKIFPKKSKVEKILTEEDDILYAVNDKLVLWKSKEGYIPVLTFLLGNRVGMKTIVVDMGAVKFVTINQADIMRPGVTKIDENIEKGDIVRIADEDNDRTLAVGKALYDAKEMKAKQSGKVVKNLHTINDSVWEFSR